MKEQKFGVEIELTGITRAKAADVIAKYFGTTKTYDGGTYKAYSVEDRQGRTWKAMRDSSIDARTKDGGMASEAYQTEIVTPVCGYEDIADIQEILRQLRHNGAIANQSCGIHIHVDASKQTAQEFKKPGQHYGGKGRPAVQGTRCNAESGNAVVQKGRATVHNEHQPL